MWDAIIDLNDVKYTLIESTLSYSSITLVLPCIAKRVLKRSNGYVVAVAKLPASIPEINGFMVVFI